MSNNEIDTIINKLQSNGGKFIDDHDYDKTKLSQLHGYIVYNKNGERLLCAVGKVDSAYFSLNPLYLDEEDGEVHLSVNSVGGTVDVVDGDLVEALNNYNEWYAKHNWNRKLEIDTLYVFQ